ncbi:response regulator [Sphingomonas glacialis]|uniref:Response regulator n=1 Tax=Sphingomonas glacialis TaxID=658225 RepID=A0A502G4J2_9SPHN|nr:response regulator [Sphingomonas glacialis]TPG56452.1 response regulator [Sphingomonas glacialis]
MMPHLDLLYVDDDPDIRTIVELALGLDPAITVRTAASGKAAIASFVTPDAIPDVVVLDVMMPEMTGPETLAALRCHPLLRETPVLFMTARGRDADIKDYLALGAAGVILKPFDPLRLAAQIRTCVGRAELLPDP